MTFFFGPATLGFFSSVNKCIPFITDVYVEFMISKLYFSIYSDELRKEARQLKKELQAIKQRKEESSKPAKDEVKEGMCANV